jgi:para-nitrobenzyl esterase
MRTIIPAVLLFLISIQLAAQPCGDRYARNIFNSFTRTPNIVYGENINAAGRNEVLKLDVFEPNNDDLPLRPLLVLMHGGAYWSGMKNMNEVVIPCRELTKMGFVTATVGYRIEPSFVSLLFEDKMIKAVARGSQDAKAAVRFFYRDVIENGNRFRIDTNFIFVGGWSAGSLNALHMAYLDDVHEMIPLYQEMVNEVGGIEGTSGNAGYSSRVAGVININGGLGSAEYMNNNTTPLVSVHNTGDPQIPFYQGKPYGLIMLPTVDGSMKIHEKALELGIYNPFYIIDNDDHTSSDFFGIPVQPYLDSTLYYISMFTREVMGCNEVVTSNPVNKIQELRMYPNPVTIQQNIQLEWPASLQAARKCVFYNMLGSKVWEHPVTPGEIIRLSALPLQSGTYVVQLLDASGQPLASDRLVVQ